MAANSLPATRDELGRTFGSHRMVKWAEDLQKGITGDLPALIASVQASADMAAQAARSAQAAAERAEQRAEELALLMLANRNQAQEIEQLRREVEALRATPPGGLTWR